MQTVQYNNAHEVAQAIDEYHKYKRAHVAEFFADHLYDWQHDFLAAGREHRQRMLLAGNRVGKTMLSAYELRCHLTGDYPWWWDGRRFDYPITSWAMGVSGEQVRDVLQLSLLGELGDKGFDGSGMIEGEHIHSFSRSPQTPRLVKEVFVKHVNGGFSKLQFKMYTQDPHTLTGASIDFILVDEQPPDAVVSQLITRTMTGARGEGGAILYSMTPELGRTRLIIKFMDEREDHQFLMQVNWSMAPHLTPEVQREILSAIPEYQHQMRRDGIPVLGVGMVFSIAEERIMCDPFEIPSYYKRLAGLDIGYMDHPTAGAWVAYDPDADCTYLTNTYSQSGEILSVNAAAMRLPTPDLLWVYPHDGKRRESDGEDMAAKYRKHGLKCELQFENPEGGNALEPGIFELEDRMRTDRFKVFNCPQTQPFLREFRMYHRDEKGKIVALDDDVISATRYAAIMVPTHGVRGSGRSQNVYQSSQLPVNAQSGQTIGRRLDLPRYDL
jgi:phage terminase large subunit-like protein